MADLTQAGDAPLRTNDHWLSLTDQMNLGVRTMELDTHWVQVISPLPPSYACSHSGSSHVCCTLERVEYSCLQAPSIGL